MMKTELSREEKKRIRKYRMIFNTVVEGIAFVLMMIVVYLVLLLHMY